LLGLRYYAEITTNSKTGTILMHNSSKTKKKTKQKTKAYCYMHQAVKNRRHRYKIKYNTA